MALNLEQAPSIWRSRLALVEADGTPHTYAQLTDAVAVEAAVLRGIAGDIDGRLVLVPGEPSLEAITRMLAAWSAGGVVMPVHPRWSPRDLESALAQARPHVDWRVTVPTVLPNGLRLAAHPGSRPAVVMFTSGTSGSRKGIVLTHQNIRAAAVASEANLGWQANDRWALAIPLAHVGGLSVVTRCLIAGACVVCAGNFDAARYHRFVQERRVTLDSLVPTMLQRVMRIRPQAPRSLRAVLVGGAAAPPALIRSARAHGWPIRLTYGMTETAAQFCTQREGDEAVDGGGPPLPGCEIDVRDDVLWVRGASVARHVLPNTTPLRIDDEGWLCTGDAAEQREDGSIYVKSRLTELVISGGENVYPQEVERALSEHPDVDSVCVVGEPSEEWGHSVVALVVWTKAAERTAGVQRADEQDGGGDPIGTLREFARQALAPHARPKRYVVVSALPETSAGKLDRGSALTLALATPSDEGVDSSA